MSKIVKIEVDEEDRVTFYFNDSKEPFSVVEFIAGSKTHERLSAIEWHIIKFNNYDWGSLVIDGKGGT